MRASIGKPFQWADGQLLGEKWQAPLGGYRYFLLRLAFTLRSGERGKLSSADFCLRLHSQTDLNGIVFDAYPKELLEEQSRSVTLEIGPNFKLGSGEASLGKIGTTIDFGVAVPVIHSEGLQESDFCWHYQVHRKHPLGGSRQMYAVVSLPPNMPSSLATLELFATQETRFGPIRLSPPETASANLRWVIGDIK